MSNDNSSQKSTGEEAASNAVPSEHLNLKVKSQDGNQVFFKVKRTTQLSKVFSAYCKKVGGDLEAYRFLFDGVRLDPGKTPKDFEMEDGDEIDAMVQQTGGRW